MKKKIDVVWVVLQGGCLVSSHPTFAQAEKEATKTLEIDESEEVRVLEVVKAWEMGWPEEPAPDIMGIGLDKL